MVTNREKRVHKKKGTKAPLHEWSGTVWHTVKVEGEWRKAVTREGKIKTWQHARRWVIEMIKQTKYVYYAEVGHVEGGEDVAVIKFVPVMGGHWNQIVRKKPWFEGSYH